LTVLLYEDARTLPVTRNCS